MKVLNIIQAYPPAIGGSERWCSKICQFLANKGLVTKVATINICKLEQSETIEQKYIDLGRYDCDKGVFITRYKLWPRDPASLKVKIIHFLLNRIKLDKIEIGSIFNYSQHSFEMYSELFKEIKQADIICLHTLPFFHNIVGYLVAKILRKKIIVIPHFHPGHPHYEKRVFFKMMSKADAIIAMSKYEKNHLAGKGIDSKKIHIAGNFIFSEEPEDKEEFNSFKLNLFNKYQISQDSKKIIFIGRKELYKGIGALLEATKQIANEKNAMKLCLLLVGADTRDFNDNLASLELNSTERLKIINFGVISEREKIHLLKMSDVLVLSSEFEAFGIVFLEAWRHKKPVIGSDKGAIPEVIEGAGLSAKYGDVRDLKEKIKQILSNEELAKKLGEAGKEKLDNKYTLKKIGGIFFNVCRALRKDKKRILIVSHLFPPYFLGGSELVAYQQCRIIERMGFGINVFAGKLNNKIKQYHLTEEKGEFEITRINLHYIDFNHYLFNFDKKVLQDKFREIIHKIAPDIVHFHNIYSLTIKIMDECFKLHIPTAMTLHDYWGICFKNLLVRDDGSLCDKRTNPRCLCCQGNLHKLQPNIIPTSERNKMLITYLNKVDLLISPSNYLIKKFINCGIQPNKTTVVNNGIDVSRFRNIKKTKSKKLRFGFIGQIVYHKGIENLLRSIFLLNSDERNKISAILVGTGEEMFVQYCKSLRKELRLENFVTFLGKVENTKINKIFNNIDVLIVPSIWPENSPVTIMEALASGTPVLASDIGGIPELIQDGVNGYLHKYDEPSSLTRNIQKIIKQPEIIERMRPACVEKAKQNELTKQVEIITQHYDRLIFR